MICPNGDRGDGDDGGRNGREEAISFHLHFMSCLQDRICVYRESWESSPYLIFRNFVHLMLFHRCEGFSLCFHFPFKEIGRSMNVDLIFMPVFLRVFEREFVQGRGAVVCVQIKERFFRRSNRFAQCLIMYTNGSRCLPSEIFILRVFANGTFNSCRLPQRKRANFLVTFRGFRVGGTGGTKFNVHCLVLPRNRFAMFRCLFQLR